MKDRQYFHAPTIADAIAELDKTVYMKPEGKNNRLTAEAFEDFIGIPPDPPVDQERRRRKLPDDRGRRRFVGEKADETRALSGSPNPSAAPRIGDGGKIWALLCFFPAFRESADKEIGPRVLAARILGERKAVNYDVDLLRALLTTTKTNSRADPKKEKEIGWWFLSAEENSPHLDFRDSVIRFVAEGLSSVPTLQLPPREKLARLLNDTVNEGHPTPAACARRLQEVLKIPSDAKAGEDAQHGTSWLEENVERYVRTRHREKKPADAANPSQPEADDSELKLRIRDITNTLGSGLSKQERTVFLYGPEESGKKAIVGDLLLNFWDEAKDEYLFKLLDERNDVKQRLPIAALSVRVQDYRRLGHHVLAFLRLQREPPNADEITLGANDPRYALRVRFSRILAEVATEFHDHTPLGKLLSAIGDLHRTSRGCMFILLDANDLTRGSQSRVLHQRGFLRLLKQLQDSNENSRFLITTADPNTTRTRRLNQHSFELLRVRMPRLKRLRWYLDAEADAARVATFERLSRQYLERRVPGDILAVYASMANLGLPGDDLGAQINDCMQALPRSATQDDHAAAGQPEMERTDPAYDAASRIAYGHYVNFLRGRGVLPAIALVAAASYSRDSLMHRSLEIMHQRLQRSFRPVADIESEQVELPLRELDRIVDSAKSMVLRRVKPEIPDDEEFSPDEASLGDNPQKSWEMGGMAAIWLLRAMSGEEANYAEEANDGVASQSRFDANLARCACREVARGARRRAQMKRLRRASPDSPATPREIARDIQCFETLLASLPPHLSDTVNLIEGGQPAARLRANSVFAIDAEFRADIAFKFAYFVLLRSDIDTRHQLTMRFDLDTTRLRCYLLLIVGCGRVSTWTVEALREGDAKDSPVLPDKLPEGVLHALGWEESALLLLTISITAYHCQLPKVVLWAWRLYRTLPREDHLSGNVREPADTHARHISTMLDAAIQLGRPLDDPEGNLENLRAQACDLRKEVDDLVVAASERGLGYAKDADAHPNEDEAQTSRVIEGQSISPAPVEIRMTRSRLRLALRQSELSELTSNDPQSAIAEMRSMERAERQDLTEQRQDSAVFTSGRSGRLYGKTILDGFPVRVRAPSTASSDLTLALSRDEVSAACETLDFIIETNLSRLNRFAGMDRIGIVADCVRVNAAREYLLSDGPPQLKRTSWYLQLIENQVMDSSVSDGAYLDLCTLRAATRWLNVWAGVRSRASAVPDVTVLETDRRELDKAQELISEATQLATALGFQPALVDLGILQFRTALLRECIDTEKDIWAIDFGAARESLSKARDLAGPLKYKSALTVIAGWSDWMDRR